MATNIRPDVTIYLIILFLIVWTILSSSPERRFKRFRKIFGLKKIDREQLDQIGQVIELNNIESNNKITINDITTIHFRNTIIPVGYGQVTNLTSRHGGWIHETTPIFFTLAFDNSDKKILENEKHLFKYVEQSEGFTLFWIKNLSKLAKNLKQQH